MKKINGRNRQICNYSMNSYRKAYLDPLSAQKSVQEKNAAKSDSWRKFAIGSAAVVLCAVAGFLYLGQINGSAAEGYDASGRWSLR